MYLRLLLQLQGDPTTHRGRHTSAGASTHQCQNGTIRPLIILCTYKNAHSTSDRRLLPVHAEFALGLQVPDVLVLKAAAQKALFANLRGNLRSRSMHAELVFSVAGSKHVSAHPMPCYVMSDHDLTVNFTGKVSCIPPMHSFNFEGEAL